jgi:hypothetical protein
MVLLFRTVNRPARVVVLIQNAQTRRDGDNTSEKALTNSTALHDIRKQLGGNSYQLDINIAELSNNDKP